MGTAARNNTLLRLANGFCEDTEIRNNKGDIKMYYKITPVYQMQAEYIDARNELEELSPDDRRWLDLYYKVWELFQRKETFIENMERAK
jgi:hypothetical protein